MFYALAAFAEQLEAPMQHIRTNPFIPHRDNVRGFVYDVDMGDLR